MYINTNITSPAIAGFGPAAWYRDGQPIKVHRTIRRRQRNTALEDKPTSDAAQPDQRAGTNS